MPFSIKLSTIKYTSVSGSPFTRPTPEIAGQMPLCSCPLATLRPAGVHTNSMAWPREDSPQGRSLPMQALKGAGGHLSRGGLCIWYGEYGPKGKMCELGGCLLMTPWTVAPQKGAQLEESLRRNLLCMDLRARAQLPGYEQYCFCLSILILITSLYIPCKNKVK